MTLLDCETEHDLDKLYMEKELWTTESRIRYLISAMRIRHRTHTEKNPLDELKDLEDLALAKIWVVFNR